MRLFVLCLTVLFSVVYAPITYAYVPFTSNSSPPASTTSQPSNTLTDANSNGGNNFPGKPTDPQAAAELKEKNLEFAKRLNVDPKYLDLTGVDYEKQMQSNIEYAKKNNLPLETVNPFIDYKTQFDVPAGKEFMNNLVNWAKNGSDMGCVESSYDHILAYTGNDLRKFITYEEDNHNVLYGMAKAITRSGCYVQIATEDENGNPIPFMAGDINIRYGDSWSDGGSAGRPHAQFYDGKEWISYTRDEAYDTGATQRFRLVHADPTMTPESYGIRDSNEWEKAPYMRESVSKYVGWGDNNSPSGPSETQYERLDPRLLSSWKAYFAGKKPGPRDWRTLKDVKY